jgi:hypothetical protein
VPRPLRLVAATSALSAALVFSLLGVVSSGASVKAGGKIVSASLTKTSFKATQAKTVKLAYKISPASKRFGYLLSLKKGAKWVKVRSVNKTGSFKGSYTMTVKTVFGSTAVKVGQYRVKISADANSLTRKFTVVKTLLPPGAFGKTSPANGATGQSNTLALGWAASSNAASYEYCIDTTNNSSCDSSWVSTNAATSANLSGLLLGTTYYWQVHAINAQGTKDADSGAWSTFAVAGPKAGYWTASAAGVKFKIAPDQANVLEFSFSFSTFGSCLVQGTDTTITPLSITNDSFGDPSVFSYTGIGGFFYLNGAFDSATSAHGTARVSGNYNCGPSFTGGLRPFDTGQRPWTATWQDASQPS